MFYELEYNNIFDDTDLNINLIEFCWNNMNPLYYTDKPVSTETVDGPDYNEYTKTYNKITRITSKPTEKELNDATDRVYKFLENDFKSFETYVGSCLDKDLYANKLLAKKKIDLDKITKQNSGVTFKDKKFQSADKDRALLTATVTLYSAAGKLPDNFTWISEDNTSVPMTLQELIQLGSLMGQVVNDTTHKARTTKDSVEKAKTVDEVKQILKNWSI